MNSEAPNYPWQLRLLLAALLLSALSGLSMASAPIGKVLLSLGQNTAVAADGTARALQRLSPLYSGDTLVTSAQGRLQLRFTDNSLLSLQANTRFAIDSYHFDPKTPADGQAAYNLLKGGMRTVTGLIGRQQKAQYKLNTPVATIGIRGTHYSLYACDQGCASQTRQAEGLYGGVTQGGIRVSNQHQDVDLGIDDFFYLADAHAELTPLLAPPALLRQEPPVNADDETDASDADSPEDETDTSDADSPEDETDASDADSTEDETDASNADSPEDDQSEQDGQNNDETDVQDSRDSNAGPSAVDETDDHNSSDSNAKPPTMDETDAATRSSVDGQPAARAGSSLNKLDFKANIGQPDVITADSRPAPPVPAAEIHIAPSTESIDSAIVEVDSTPSTDSTITEVDSTPSTDSTITEVDSAPSTDSTITEVDSTPRTDSTITEVDSAPNTDSTITEVDSTPSTDSTITEVDSIPNTDSTDSTITEVDSTPSTDSTITEVDSAPSTDSTITEVDSAPNTDSTITEVDSTPSTDSTIAEVGSAPNTDSMITEVDSPPSMYDTESTYGTDSMYDTESTYSTDSMYDTESTYSTDSMYDTESTYGTDSMYDTESTYSTDSMYDTESTYSTDSMYDTESTYSTDSMYDTESTYSTDSMYDTESTYSTDSMYDTESTYSTDSMYDTESTYSTDSTHDTDTPLSTYDRYYTDSSNASDAPQGAVTGVSFIETEATEGLHTGGAAFLVNSLNTVRLDRVNGADNIPVFVSVQEVNTELDDDACTPCTFSSQGATLTDVGGLDGPGLGVNWGRWQQGWTITPHDDHLDSKDDLHFIYSPHRSSETLVRGLSGVYRFKLAGGTVPTDEANQVGEWLGDNLIDIDFDRQLVVNLRLNIKVGSKTVAARPLHGVTALEQLLSQQPLLLKASCSGGNCGTSTDLKGDLSVDFIGPDAERLISAWGLFEDHPSGGTSTIAISGVSAYDRDITLTSSDSLSIAPAGSTLSLAFIGNNGESQGLQLESDNYTTIVLDSVSTHPDVPVYAQFDLPPSDTTNGCQGCEISSASATLSDGGALHETGKRINWGRWDGNWQASGIDPDLSGTGSVHFIHSADSTPASTVQGLRGSGTLNYGYLSGSGTAPSDEGGNLGTLNSSGSVTVDFDAMAITAVNLDIAVSDRNIAVAASAPQSIDNILAHQPISLSASCSGGSCGAGSTLQGQMHLNFVGPAAERLISSYGLQQDLVNPTTAVSGTAVFEK